MAFAAFFLETKPTLQQRSPLQHYRYSNNTATIQTIQQEYSKNTARIQQQYSNNTASIQQEYSKNTARIQQEYSKNTATSKTKCRSIVMQKETYPCSLRTAARETLSHAHRGSNSECRTTPWGGHAHVCTPPTDCASGHHPSRQQTTLGP